MGIGGLLRCTGAISMSISDDSGLSTGSPVGPPLRGASASLWSSGGWSAEREEEGGSGAGGGYSHGVSASGGSSRATAALSSTMPTAAHASAGHDGSQHRQALHSHGTHVPLSATAKRPATAPAGRVDPVEELAMLQFIHEEEARRERKRRDALLGPSWTHAPGAAPSRSRRVWAPADAADQLPPVHRDITLPARMSMSFDVTSMQTTTASHSGNYGASPHFSVMQRMTTHTWTAVLAVPESGADIDSTRWQSPQQTRAIADAAQRIAPSIVSSLEAADPLTDSRRAGDTRAQLRWSSRERSMGERSESDSGSDPPLEERTRSWTLSPPSTSRRQDIVNDAAGRDAQASDHGSEYHGGTWAQSPSVMDGGEISRDLDADLGIVADDSESIAPLEATSSRPRHPRHSIDSATTGPISAHRSRPRSATSRSTGKRLRRIKSASSAGRPLSTLADTTAKTARPLAQQGERRSNQRTHPMSVGPGAAVRELRRKRNAAKLRARMLLWHRSRPADTQFAAELYHRIAVSHGLASADPKFAEKRKIMARLNRRKSPIRRRPASASARAVSRRLKTHRPKTASAVLSPAVVDPITEECGSDDAEGTDAPETATSAAPEVATDDAVAASEAATTSKADPGRAIARGSSQSEAKAFKRKTRTVKTRAKGKAGRRSHKGRKAPRPKSAGLRPTRRPTTAAAKGNAQPSAADKGHLERTVTDKAVHTMLFGANRATFMSAATVARRERVAFDAILRIQAVWRAQRVRRAMLKLRTSVAVVIGCLRRLSRRNRLQRARFLVALRKLQSAVRARQTREWNDVRQQSAPALQAAARMRLERKQFLRAQRAVLVLQCSWRCYTAFHRVAKLRREHAKRLAREAVAVALQAHYRGAKPRALVRQWRHAVWPIQRQYKRWRRYVAQKTAGAIEMQRLWRGFCARQFMKHTRSSVHIQKGIRRSLAVARLEELRRRAIEDEENAARKEEAVVAEAASVAVAAAKEFLDTKAGEGQLRAEAEACQAMALARTQPLRTLGPDGFAAGVQLGKLFNPFGMQIERVFEIWDVEERGYLNREQVGDLLEELGCPMTADELDADFQDSWRRDFEAEDRAAAAAAAARKKDEMLQKLRANRLTTQSEAGSAPKVETKTSAEDSDSRSTSSDSDSAADEPSSAQQPKRRRSSSDSRGDSSDGEDADGQSEAKQEVVLLPTDRELRPGRIDLGGEVGIDVMEVLHLLRRAEGEQAWPGYDLDVPDSPGSAEHAQEGGSREHSAASADEDSARLSTEEGSAVTEGTEESAADSVSHSVSDGGEKTQVAPTRLDEEGGTSPPTPAAEEIQVDDADALALHTESQLVSEEQNSDSASDGDNTSASGAEGDLHDSIGTASMRSDSIRDGQGRPSRTSARSTESASSRTPPHATKRSGSSDDSDISSTSSSESSIEGASGSDVERAHPDAEQERDATSQDDADGTQVKPQDEFNPYEEIPLPVVLDKKLRWKRTSSIRTRQAQERVSRAPPERHLRLARRRILHRTKVGARREARRIFRERAPPPFACPVCPARFAFARLLRRHVSNPPDVSGCTETARRAFRGLDAVSPL